MTCYVSSLDPITGLNVVEMMRDKDRGLRNMGGMSVRKALCNGGKLQHRGWEMVWLHATEWQCTLSQKKLPPLNSL